MAMREYTSSVLQKDYSLEDLMQAVIDAYEVRYNEIVKAHENGDRQVTSSYDPSKAFYTLEEDLAALDWAYERELANIAAFIVCRQTNDGHKFFTSMDAQKAKEGEEYRNTAISMRKEQGKDC